MRIILSRKGFDSTSGGGPSPIIGGRPFSLPIPAAEHSRTTYGALRLGEHAARASRGRIGAGDHCHHDPMFLADGTCLFGQCGAAQTHLANRGVGAGDVFLFFGLFREEDTGEPHHRIFGYLEVERRIDLANCDAVTLAGLRDQGHPHAIAMHARNDAIYRGRGREAVGAPDLLRLTAPGGPPSLWRRPAWLQRGEFSYHDRTDRWLPGDRLRAVSRGQEFVAEIGRRKAPREWLARVIAAIEAS